MSRTSHRWHIEICPHCGREEKVQNRSYRYVAPNNVVGAVTGYKLGEGVKLYYAAGDDLYKAGEFRRTTIHRVACARKRGIPAYES